MAKDQHHDPFSNWSYVNFRDDEMSMIQETSFKDKPLVMQILRLHAGQCHYRIQAGSH